MQQFGRQKIGRFARPKTRNRLVRIFVPRGRRRKSLAAKGY